jgi:splicing factor 3B subunit 3
VIPRWLVNTTVLDYDTIAGCDKFENFFVYRIPKGADDESEEDPMGTKLKWEIGYLNAAAFKLDLLAQFHRGEMITQLRKCSLSGGSENCILYMTSLGSIGVFVPMTTREESDFFQHLEMYMRMENQPLSGRDHMMFRSVYGPVKCVVDGDLCEEFSSLTLSKQKALAMELDKTASEIEKKIEEIKNKVL